MTQENVETVRRLVEAFNRGDVDGVLAAFSEDCQLVEPPEMPDSPEGGFRGHEGIRQWMANLKAIGEITFESKGFRVDGDIVVSEWAARGLGQASGAPFEWQTFTVLQLRDGKVVRGRAFLSEAEALAAAGLVD